MQARFAPRTSAAARSADFGRLTRCFGWLILIAAAALLLIRPVQAGLSETRDPAAWVQAFGAAAVVMLKDESLSEAEREDAFRALLQRGFHLPVIGRFALGRHWRHASPAQRADYAALFEDYIVASYARRLVAYYSGETLTVGAARLRGDNGAIVESAIVRPGGGGIRIDWRLRRDDASWRIVDLVIEGVSLAIAQRAEFGAVISGGGGRLEPLLGLLRKKTAGLRTAASAGAGTTTAASQ